MAMSGKVLGEQMAELARVAAQEKWPPISDDLKRRIDADFERLFPNRVEPKDKP